MKTKLLEIGRWLCVLLAVLSLGWMFGRNTLSQADPAAVEAAVTEKLDMTNVLKADNLMIRRLYGLDPAAYESCCLYYPSTNMVAEELLIIKLTDTNQQEAVRSAIEARLQTQKASFDGYGIEQYDMLTKDAVIEVRGNYVLYVVNAGAQEALQAFLAAL